eukprot:TRINITY_DN1842_c0_g1_i5.p2 TRINITY_DN1842_c0_g1~~TRINITY_DN1842_c0_g1_i5.p2  ORF type:complete len:135 (+),score=38.32 TRINITY_DN1842_c0_g1_i5:1215-1619(+)
MFPWSKKKKKKWSGLLSSYMNTLMNAFNANTCENVMCRNLVNVGWDGGLYDCDFNQALEIGIHSFDSCGSHDGGVGDGGRDLKDFSSFMKRPVSSVTLWDIHNFEELIGREIRTDLHCLACTAGAGSSCGGALE